MTYSQRCMPCVQVEPPLKSRLGGGETWRTLGKREAAASHRVASGKCSISQGGVCLLFSTRNARTLVHHAFIMVQLMWQTISAAVVIFITRSMCLSAASQDNFLTCMKLSWGLLYLKILESLASTAGLSLLGSPSRPDVAGRSDFLPASGLRWMATQRL